LNVKKDNSTCDGKGYLRCFRKGCLRFSFESFLRHIFDGSFLKKLMVDLFICPTNNVLNICKKIGYTNSVLLPHYTVSLKEDSRKRLHIDNSSSLNSNNILFVGRIIKAKGVFDLIDAFEISVAKNKDLRLIFVGDGLDIKELKNATHEKKLDDYVIFVGEIKHKDISRYYLDSFVVIVPSILNESFGLVALEAMNHSRPVIAYSVGGLPELIIDKKNGFLIKKGDIDGLAESILYLSKDKKESFKMGKIGRLMVEKKYNKEMHLSRLLGFYDSILDNNKV